MKSFYRTSSLLCIFLVSIFFKKDINSEYILPAYASSVFATNLYHDGFNDIIVGHTVGWGYNNPAITLMKNIYFGTFELTDTTKCFCGGQDNIFAVDVNNDGWPDIVAFYIDFSTGTVRNYVRIYYNDNGNFPNDNYRDFNLNSSAIFTDITYGDINGDGYIDLIVSSNNWNFWGILYNNGNGGFSSPVYYTLSGPVSAICCGDLNGDGCDDIVICAADTKIYFGYPTGFQLLTLDPYVFMQHAAIVDFDLDGKRDILTQVYVWTGQFSILRIFKNLGNNAFQQLPDLIFQGGVGPLVTSDFNNDGLPDVLFTGINGHIIWYNQGNFQLADSQYVAIPYHGGTSAKVCCADLDNNGFNDIITVSYGVAQNYPSLDIMFNDGHGNFTPNPIVGNQEKDDIVSSLKNYPNPFQDETTFEFYIKETSLVELSVFDLQGRFTTCLINQKLETGLHSIKWRGLDNGDQPSKPGAFIAYLKVNGKICRTIKVVKT